MKRNPCEKNEWFFCGILAFFKGNNACFYRIFPAMMQTAAASLAQPNPLYFPKNVTKKAEKTLAVFRPTSTYENNPYEKGY
jgi:hypothetical protein